MLFSRAALGLALATFLVTVDAKDVTCTKGKKTTKVTLNEGDSFSFDHSGSNYAGKQKCKVNYKLGTCTSASVSCDVFDLNAKSNCKGDFISLASKGTTAQKFCQTNGPTDVTFTKAFSVLFKSNKKKSGSFSCDVSCTSGPGVTTEGPATTGGTSVTAAATTTASVATSTVASDEIMERVKGYIDAGTCSTSISSNGNCGDSATSYYKEITYNGKRVIISNQVPDHDAEHDQLVTNPNTRCERWQFTQLPIDPTKSSNFVATGLGTTGLAVTGGAFFNDLSSPQGSLALYNEGATLDSCFGHSAREGSYHYHANINCTNAGAATGANNPDNCILVGYMLDGVPVYGFCKDAAGQVMRSCYKLTDSADVGTVTTVAGTYTVGKMNTDYEFDTAGLSAGTCQLDQGNGAIHPITGKYSYFMTVEHPFIPIGYNGVDGKQRLCSAA